MTLKLFLKKVGGSETSIQTIYIEKEALKAVEQDGYALQYVDKRVFKVKVTKKLKVKIQ